MRELPSNGESEVERLRRELAEVRARLEELETQRDAIFDKNPAIKLLIDPATGRIVAASSAAVAFYGYPRERLESMSIADINMMPPELVQREMERARTQRRTSFEFRHRLASGDIRDVAVYSGPARVEGRELLFSIIHDITEQKRLAGQLEQAQKIEAMGRLAGCVAHDFNNLLTAVLCLSDIAKAKLDAEHPAAPSIAEIRKVGDRAAALTRQLLAFSRTQVLKPTLCEPSHVVRDMESLLRSVLGEIPLELRLRDGIGAVIADRSQIEQVLLNLAINARDAMPEGGVVTIETGETNVVCGAQAERLGIEPGTYLHIAVRDTGTGIAPEAMPRIFEPFFTTKPRGEGTGLGLATAYGIVRQSGGAIAVETSPGAGSTFSVLLPRLESAAEQIVPGAPVVVRRGGSETVLLVEDDETIRKLTREILEEHGYRVLDAANGALGLEVLQRLGSTIDLVVTDVVMPRMGGREMIDAARRMQPALRVLYTSGHVDSPVVERELRDAAAAFLQKPYARDDLLAKVRAVLDGDRPLSVED